MKKLALMALMLSLTGCGQLYKNEALPPLVPLSEQVDLVSDSFVMMDLEGVKSVSYLADGFDKTLLLSDHDIGTYHKKTWTHGATLDTKSRSDLAVDENAVYFTNEANQLVAYDHQKGVILWRLDLEHPGLSSPVVQGDYIYLQARNGAVLAISKRNRKVAWHYHRKMPVLTIETKAKPVVSGKQLLVGFADGFMVSLNAISGEFMWEKRMANPSGRTELARLVAVNTPAIVDESIIVTTYHGSMTRLSLNGMHTLWREKVSSKQPAVVTGNVILLVDDKNNIQGFSLKTGELLWHQPLLRRRNPTILATRGNDLVIGDGYGYVHLLRISDGELMGRIALEEKASFHLPAQFDGDSIYTVSSKGTFHKILIKDVDTNKKDTEE